MITTEEVTTQVHNAGFKVAYDYVTKFMVIARIWDNDNEYLLRLGASRCAVWRGKDRINQSGGRTWQGALNASLSAVRKPLSSPAR